MNGFCSTFVCKQHVIRATEWLTKHLHSTFQSQVIVDYHAWLYIVHAISMYMYFDQYA